MISVYIDTNCINARQNDQFLNELEKLYLEEKILIEKTDTLDTELQENKKYPLGQKKSLSYIESYGPAVFGHSRWGSTIFADEHDEKRLTKVLAILFGPKSRQSYGRNDIRDAMHISTAIRYGGGFFVTSEKALIDKAKEIEKEFGIKIRTPQDCLTEVKDLISRGY